MVSPASVFGWGKLGFNSKNMISFVGYSYIVLFFTGVAEKSPNAAVGPMSHAIFVGKCLCVFFFVFWTRSQKMLRIRIGRYGLKPVEQKLILFEIKFNGSQLPGHGSKSGTKIYFK
jgi:hypothetical protein